MAALRFGPACVHSARHSACVKRIPELELLLLPSLPAAATANSLPWLAFFRSPAIALLKAASSAAKRAKKSAARPHSLLATAPGADAFTLLLLLLLLMALPLPLMSIPTLLLTLPLAVVKLLPSPRRRSCWVRGGRLSRTSGGGPLVKVAQLRCKLMATPNTKCSIPRSVNSGEASLCTPPLPPLTLKLEMLEGDGGGRLKALFRWRLVAEDETDDEDDGEEENDELA